MAPKKLTGITWNHSRGYVPLVATAQRYLELEGVEVTWHKRSLQSFADQPIEELARRYDFLIIDHPFVGYAATHSVLLPLDEWLPSSFLDDQAANSVGPSHASYQAGGHQWALATDAATPVASYRPDVLERHGLDLPTTWDELLQLADSGMVALPGIPIDSLMNFYFVLDGLGATLFDGQRVVEEDIGTHGLEMLRDLVERCAPECAERNPIRTYDALARGDDLAYCPFAYGYSNYGRRGYGEHLLRFTDVVGLNDRPGRTTLGGTGLAVSSATREPEEAARYAAFVNAGRTQRTLFVENGGQPGHRSAWLDCHADELTNGFFRATLPTHDRAYLRPRFDGYVYFQDRAGPMVREYIDGRARSKDVVARLNELYHVALRGSDALSEDGA